MIVEKAAVVNALDQIGATVGNLEHVGRLRVQLNFPAAFAPYFDQTLLGT